MALDAVANLIKVTASAQASGDTTVTLSTSDAAKLPTPPVNLSWWNSTDYPDPADDPNVEIVRVTAVNGGTGVITVTRAQEGTSATNKNTAGKTYKMSLDITAKMITDIGNLLVGYRSTYANFTTAGGDTIFTITPPSGTVNAVQHMVIGSQVFVQGGGKDFTVSGNVVTLASAYSGPAGAPVIIIYTY